MSCYNASLQYSREGCAFIFDAYNAGKRAALESFPADEEFAALFARHNQCLARLNKLLLDRDANRTDL